MVSSAPNDGDTHNGPCEQLEMRPVPILIEKHELRDRNSGGAGRHHGGLGTEMVIHALSSPITVMCLADRMHCAPSGPARRPCRPWQPGDGLRSTASRSRTKAMNSKIGARRLRPGDCLNCVPAAAEASAQDRGAPALVARRRQAGIHQRAERHATTTAFRLRPTTKWTPRTSTGSLENHVAECSPRPDTQQELIKQLQKNGRYSWMQLRCSLSEAYDCPPESERPPPSGRHAASGCAIIIGMATFFDAFGSDHHRDDSCRRWCRICGN